jgi:hypothetical protein
MSSLHPHTPRKHFEILKRSEAPVWTRRLTAKYIYEDLMSIFGVSFASFLKSSNPQEFPFFIGYIEEFSLLLFKAEPMHSWNF